METTCTPGELSVDVVMGRLRSINFRNVKNLIVRQLVAESYPARPAPGGMSKDSLTVPHLIDRFPEFGPGKPPEDGRKMFFALLATPVLKGVVEMLRENYDVLGEVYVSNVQVEWKLREGLKGDKTENWDLSLTLMMEKGRPVADQGE